MWLSVLIPAGVAMFAGLISLVTWLMMALMKHIKDGGHQTEEQRRIVVDAIEAQIKAHSELDEQRFRAIEEMLKEMRQDIKTLLKRRTR